MATLDPASQAADPPAVVTRRPLVIVGGGEHAGVVADAARTAEAWQLIGFTDPDPSPGAASALSLDHLGEEVALARRSPAGSDEGPWFVLGIGALTRRREIVAAMPAASWATVVHRTAWVSPTARVEPGAVVLAGAIVNSRASVGAHAIVNSGAIVEHDVVVGPFAHLAPGATIGGGSRIGEGAFVALGAAVRDHVEVGDDAVVGMGSVVVDSVPSGVTVTGSPARPIGDARAG